MGYSPPTIPTQSYLAGTLNGRRCVMALGGTGDNGLVTPTNSDVCQRYGFTIPSTSGNPITRVRFRIRNSNVTANTTQAGSITTTGIYVGTPNTGAENSWSGDFTATPTTLVAGTSAEMGTTEYITAWVPASTFQFLANTFYGISLGFTCTGVQVGKSTAPGWSWVGTGASASAGAAAVPTGTGQPYLQYLDVRMEYEFSGTNQIGFFLGDSIMAGNLNTISASAAVGHMGPDNTWPQIAGLRLSHHVMNGGVGGMSAAKAVVATPATNLAWSRFFNPDSTGNGANLTGFACVPDYLALSLGINDTSVSTTVATVLSTYQTNVRTIVADAVSLGIPRAYASTMTTGYNVFFFAPGWQAGQLSTALAGSFTSIVVAAVKGPGANTGQPGANGAWFSGTCSAYVGTPQSPNAAPGPFTITGASGGSGATLTITASGTCTAAVGTPVLSGFEYNRQTLNKYIRSLPPGITSVLDFDADTTTQFYYPSATGRPEFYNNDGDIHPTNIAMYALMAFRFANGILGN